MRGRGGERKRREKKEGVEKQRGEREERGISNKTLSRYKLP